MTSLWHRFNAWIDPKFGWHVLWIVPLLVVGSIVGKIRFQLKRVAKKELTEDQKRLQVLAGIRKDSK